MLVSFCEVSEITDARLQNRRTLRKETALVPSHPTPSGAAAGECGRTGLSLGTCSIRALGADSTHQAGCSALPPPRRPFADRSGHPTPGQPGVWPPPGPGAGGDGEHLRLARSCLAAPSRPRPRSWHHCDHGVWARGTALRALGCLATSCFPRADTISLPADVGSGTPSRRVTARPGRESSPPGHRRSC